MRHVWTFWPIHTFTKRRFVLVQPLSLAVVSNTKNTRNSNYLFVAVAFETFGPWDKEAKDFIDAIGQKLNVLTGSNASSNYLQQRVSIQRYEIFYILSR